MPHKSHPDPTYCVLHLQCILLEVTAPSFCWLVTCHDFYCNLCVLGKLFCSKTYTTVGHIWKGMSVCEHCDPKDHLHNHTTLYRLSHCCHHILTCLAVFYQQFLPFYSVHLDLKLQSAENWLLKHLFLTHQSPTQSPMLLCSRVMFSAE